MCPPCGGDYVCFASSDAGSLEFAVESESNSDGTCTYLEELEHAEGEGVLSSNVLVTQSDGETGSWTAAGTRVTVCVSGTCYACTPGEAEFPGNNGGNDSG